MFPCDSEDEINISLVFLKNIFASGNHPSCLETSEQFRQIEIK